MRCLLLDAGISPRINENLGWPGAYRTRDIYIYNIYIYGLPQRYARSTISESHGYSRNTVQLVLLVFLNQIENRSILLTVYFNSNIIIKYEVDHPWTMESYQINNVKIQHLEIKFVSTCRYGHACQPMSKPPKINKLRLLNTIKNKFYDY